MTTTHLKPALVRERHVLLRCAVIALMSAVAVPSSAQRIPDLNAPRRAAEKAADAENARLSAQTGQELPVRRGAPTAAAAKSSGPGSVPAPKAGAVTNGPSTTVPSVMAPVTREVYEYAAEGRRDPFFSLILTEDLRPLLSDLKLVAVLYDASGRRSVAIMRDLATNAQYRVNSGQTIGRMRVAQIKPRVVIFTIDEFGLSRQDSLFLVDSTKVRNK
ncbi:hypothetical protein BH11GEM2_BH11GEM2_03580 [soil metagenome]